MRDTSERELQHGFESIGTPVATVEVHAFAYHVFTTYTHAGRYLPEKVDRTTHTILVAGGFCRLILIISELREDEG